MPNLKKYTVVQIGHEDGEMVYCWGEKMGLKTVESCIVTHPQEPITVSVVRMTEKQYDALDDYDGDC